MMRTPTLGLLVAVALALTACGGGGGGGGSAGGVPVEVTLEEQNASGQSGTATFNKTDDGTNIVVELISSVTEGDVQPAGIYAGTCADVADAEPTVKLPDVVQGIGGATIDTPVEELTTEPHAIAVRVSAEDDTVVACGDIARE
jgi:ABC-type glycerol-3-phosphate transport system substrate-binding protein